jgi:hypothetical protein
MKRNNVVIIFLTVILTGLFLVPMAPALTGAANNQETGDNSAALSRPMEGWFAAKFDPLMHTKAERPVVIRDDRINPLLQKKQRQLSTFQTTVDEGVKPGIDYLTAGAAVCAVAPGIVHFVGQRGGGAGKGEGLYIRIYHDFYDGLQKESYPRLTLYRNQAYRSTYYNLSAIKVIQWQAVKRGQVIGYGLKFDADGKEKVKLVLEERGTFVNPDAYGPNHGFMRFFDETAAAEIDLDEMNRRADRQDAFVEKFNSFYADQTADNIYRKIIMVTDTEKYKNYAVRWSALDRFRYLTHLYQQNCQLFPNLTSDKLASLTRRFYDSQPIVLTLPFKK